MRPIWETKAFTHSVLPLEVYHINQKGGRNAESRLKNITETPVQSYVYKDCQSDGVHWHDYFEILLFTTPGAEVEVNSRTYVAGQGDVVLVNPFDIHVVRGTAQYTVLLLNHREVGHLPQEWFTEVMPGIKGKRHYPAFESQGIVTAVEQLVYDLECGKQQGKAQLLSGMFKLLHELERAKMTYGSLADEADQRTVRLEDDGVMAGVLSYIDSNFDHEITLDEVAELAGFTSQYFCRYFKQTTGRTLITYINEVRCQQARDLLLKSQKSVADIASACGFSSISYFGRVFRKFYNKTPLEMRKEALSD